MRTASRCSVQDLARDEIDRFLDGPMVGEKASLAFGP
jgi:hypothetical protein